MANQDEAVDRVGLGVDLLGGPEVLTELRAIRVEYEALIELGTKVTQATGSSPSLNAPRTSSAKTLEQEQKAALDRMAKQEIANAKEITDAEVKIRADAAERTIELKKRTDAELLKREKERLEKQAQLEEQAAQREAQARAERISKQRAQYANQRSPALARDINRMPDMEEIPVRSIPVTRAVANVELRKQRAEEQQKIQEDRSAYANMGRRAYELRTEREQITKEYDLLKEEIIAGNKEVATAITTGKEEIAAASREGLIPGTNRVSSIAGKTEAEIAEEKRAAQAKAEVQLNLRREEGEQARKDLLVKRGRQRAADREYVKSQLAPPSGPGGGGPSGALNQRGFFTTADAVGRITRNLLIYQGVSLVTKDLVEYAEAAVEAAKKSVDLGRAMDFATEQSHGNIEANRALRDSYKELGISRAEAQQIVTQAARFTQDRSEDTKALADVITNVAASRGEGLAKIPQIIQDLRDRRPRVFEEYFNTKPEDLYKQYAQNKIDTDSGQGFVGIDKHALDREQRISKIVSALSDQQKHEIELNYILSQSSKYQGEAADRANTLAGRIDRVSASLANATEIVGLFITDIKPLNDLLDSILAKGGMLDKYRPAELGRHGEGGLPDEVDKARYIRETTSGPRARLLGEVNTLAVPTIESGAVIAGLSLFGRNQAKATYQLSEYNKLVAQYTSEFGYTTEAARKAAQDQVTNLKPGLIRSVNSGLERVTIGLKESVTNTYNSVASTLTASSAGRRGQIVSRTADTLGAQGPYSLYNANQIAAQAASVQRGTAIAGGIAGAVLGATLGTIVAEKLQVGPITATAMTIVGGIAGSAAGTAVGQSVGAGVGALVGSTGGIAATLGTEISALFAAGGAATVAITSGVVLAGLAIGGAIGTGINSLLPEWLSPANAEAARNARQNAASEARKKELGIQDSLKAEHRLVYEDLRQPVGSSPLSPEEARRRGGLEKGLDTPGAVYRQRVLTPEQARPKTEGDLDRRIADVVSENNLNVTSASDLDAVTQAQIQVNALLTEQEAKLKNIQQYRADDTEAIKQATDELNKLRVAQAELTDDAQKKRDLKEYGTLDPVRLEEAKKAKEERNKQQAIEDAAEAQRAAKREAERQERIAQQSAALSRLRYAKEGSFELISKNAEQITGSENPFTRLLAEQETLVTRMHQQWAFAGKDIEDYQTKLESLSLKRQLLNLDYAAYEKATNLRGQARAEADQRAGPGLSRKEQDYLDIQNAIVDKALEIPKLWAKAAEVLGYAIDPIEQLQSRIASLQVATGFGATQGSVLGMGRYGPQPDVIAAKQYGEGGIVVSDDTAYRGTIKSINYGQTRDASGQYSGGYKQLLEPQEGGRIEGFNSGAKTSTIVLADGSLVTMQMDQGQQNDYSAYFKKQQEIQQLSPEARGKLQTSAAEATLSVLDEYTPAQIRAAGLGGVYQQAIQTKAGGLDQRIQDAQAKAQYGAIQDQRLQDQLEEDKKKRAEAIAKGEKPEDVGRASDALLIARTNNIPLKDLTVEQFKDRSEALQRQADSAETDRKEAAEAVKTAAEARAAMVQHLSDLKEAIINGDMSVLIQVQNDTEARVDTERLQNANPGANPKDTKAKKSDYVNPAKESTRKYGSFNGEPVDR